MNKSISPKITALTFGILTIAFLTAFYVVAWQEPSQAPPQANVAAPLNVSSVGQIKAGNLVVNAFGISGSGGNLFSMPAGAGAGKVLTSDASGTGTWQESSIRLRALFTYWGAPSRRCGSHCLDSTCKNEQSGYYTRSGKIFAQTSDSVVETPCYSLTLQYGGLCGAPCSVSDTGLKCGPGLTITCSQTGTKWYATGGLEGDYPVFLCSCTK